MCSTQRPKGFQPPLGMQQMNAGAPQLFAQGLPPSYDAGNPVNFPAPSTPAAPPSPNMPRLPDDIEGLLGRRGRGPRIFDRYAL